MSSPIPKEGRTKYRSTQYPQSNTGAKIDRENKPSFKYVVTFAVAIVADSLQVAFPVLWIPASIVTAVIFFALWGWRLEILGAFIPELVPGLALIPSWVAIAFILTKFSPIGTKIEKSNTNRKNRIESARE